MSPLFENSAHKFRWDADVDDDDPEPLHGTIYYMGVVIYYRVYYRRYDMIYYMWAGVHYMI